VSGRILVACVGNVIRRDDGFGPAVGRRLADTALPPGVELAEFGIAGVALVQQLMEGYDGLIIVDAIAADDVPPGTVLEVDPVTADLGHHPWTELRAALGDVHETTPRRVLALARSAGCLPRRVRIVGCRPEDVDVGTTLTPRVAAAVETAATNVTRIVAAWRAGQVS
jgi:hydrogenase maturation protease